MKLDKKTHLVGSPTVKETKSYRMTEDRKIDEGYSLLDGTNDNEFSLI